jgi:hypothetical protein
MQWFIINLNRCIAVAVVSIVLTASASACPVCAANRTGAPQRTAWALYASTGGMMLLPVTMIGGFVWWLRKNL